MPTGSSSKGRPTREFYSVLTVKGEIVGKGKGFNKTTAEEKAAREYLLSPSFAKTSQAFKMADDAIRVIDDDDDCIVVLACLDQDIAATESVSQHVETSTMPVPQVAEQAIVHGQAEEQQAVAHGQVEEQQAVVPRPAEQQPVVHGLVVQQAVQAVPVSLFYFFHFWLFFLLLFIFLFYIPFLFFFPFFVFFVFPFSFFTIVLGFFFFSIFYFAFDPIRSIQSHVKGEEQSLPGKIIPSQ